MARVILLWERPGPANQGGVMAAESEADVQHHRAPRCLLGHFDAAAAGGLADWSELNAEAERLSIEVRGLSREGLAAQIQGFTLEIPTTEHRTLHQEEGDFVRWGRRGGLRILSLYGPPYFSLLARLRWGCIDVEALIEHRARSLRGAGRERGPYWYFQFHESGKRKKLYLGKTSDPETTLAAKRAR